MTTRTSISGSPSQNFPKFMAFDVDPEKGPNFSVWRVKPYQYWGLQEEATKTALKRTAVGSALGGGAGAVTYYLQDKIKFLDKLGLDKVFEPVKKLRDFVALGFAVGTIAGATEAFIETRYFSPERPIVVNATKKSAEKAKQIIQAFVSAHEDEDTFCPIGDDIMVYPVRTSCDHIFEHFRIAHWIMFSLATTGETQATCPICRRAVYLEDLTFDPSKEREIHEKVAVIFKKMEAILERFPKRFFGFDTLPHLSDTAQMTALAEEIKDGKNMLEGDVQELAKKIQQPETLSYAEALGLAHFLIHQMGPLKDKISQAHTIADKYLASARDKGTITTETYIAQRGQLDKWYKNFNIVPEECKILRRLYNM